ncbi:hypothetical protein [Dyadobacter sp. CY343]|uniref:hypothetical protein n=1 Tax=Dyadobacter sp. CY343 TaxID=2907299 RepID=UPI001F3B7684|nr:hypothetical protein [Dyadobacter sp. CY343]MCE7061423.1 hypothetical protein [Dyadobacter sp. CY343]
MKTLLTIVTCIMIVSCSGTGDELTKTGDLSSNANARFSGDSHISYPTLKSKLVEEAQAELKATGDDSKLVALDELGHLKLADSLYATDFQKIELTANEDGIPLINRYNALITSYSHNPYQQAHIQSALSRRILVNLGLVGSDYFPTIAYFTDQLLDSHMGEYQLILKCLEKLKGNVPVDQISQMSTKLRHQIENSRTNEIELAKGIQAMIIEREKQLADNPSQKKGRLMLSSLKEIDLGLRQRTLEQCSDRLSRI